MNKDNSFLLTDIELLKNKIHDLKQLSRQGVKECLSSVQLSTTGNKETLDKRLIEYILSGEKSSG